jgi:hypothetical protein
LYCSSTDIDCSMASRMSGLTMRTSAKCRTRRLTMLCRPGAAAASAGAVGVNGGSPRRSA